MTKIYISGKVTGLKNPQWKFERTENHLKKLGYEVVNPTVLCEGMTSWRDAMKICIKHLLECDAIYMQPDWVDSRGSKIELKYAQKNGLEVIFE